MISKRQVTELIKKCKEISSGNMGASLIIATLQEDNISYEITVNLWNGKVFASGKSNTEQLHYIAADLKEAEAKIQEIIDEYGAINGRCQILFDDFR